MFDMLRMDHIGRVLQNMKAVPWTDTIKYTPLMRIDGATFTPQKLFDTEPVRDPDVDKQTPTSGKWGYYNRILPANTVLNLHVGRNHGFVSFTTDVVIPIIYEDYVHNVWMSTTPSEIISQRPGIRRATGKVLIGGLGLGGALDQICRKPSVKEVILVEKSKELLDWFGYDLAKKYPKVTQVIHGDVFDELGEHGDDVRHILDVWISTDGASYDKRVKVARQKYPGIKMWCWGERKLSDAGR